MEDIENKYIKLLLTKCLNFNKSSSLFINYNKVNKSFVTKVVKFAKEIGVIDIYLDEEDNDVNLKKLEETSINEIEQDSYFDKSIWDEYAKKNASFLMLETEFPGLYDNVDPKIVAKARFINRKTRPLFREKETSYQIPWCIAVLPNEVWAKDIFKNEEDAYEKLFNVICKVCMLDTKDPIRSWDEYLIKAKSRAKKLTELKIKTLTYKNNLGTNLTVKMPDNAIWVSAADDKDMFVNMPSYEIFSSPDYRYTNGIVYSSKPLIYGGGKVDKFYIEFKDGKVINYDAKYGKEILKQIIESDEFTSYLGEVALVNYDSPISNTKLIFGTTLFDENASCHLALGDGFPDCIEDGINQDRETLKEKGINHSQNHVDFMIGTSDLEIEAETKDGKKHIFKNGNFKDL